VKYKARQHERVKFRLSQGEKGMRDQTLPSFTLEQLKASAAAENGDDDDDSDG
jgi:hypothetical protein